MFAVRFGALILGVLACCTQAVAQVDRPPHTVVVTGPKAAGFVQSLPMTLPEKHPFPNNVDVSLLPDPAQPATRLHSAKIREKRQRRHVNENLTSRANGWPNTK